jgi:S1-C subfamily serine protease
MRGAAIATAGLALIAACAEDPVRAPPPSVSFDSPLSSSIGIAVAPMGRDVVVVAVRAGSAAARAHLQPGDRMRLEGEQLTDATDFERRVLDAKPGTVMRVEFSRGTQTRVVELPVEELLLAVRA